MQENNVYNVDYHRQIVALEKLLGGLAECKRLGFVFEDKQGIMSISEAGLGYLLYIEAGGIDNLAEAFAAGYDCAKAND